MTRKRNHPIKAQVKNDVTLSRDSEPITREPGKHYRKPSRNFLKTALSDLLNSRIITLAAFVVLCYEYSPWRSPDVAKTLELKSDVAIQSSSPILSHTSLFVPYVLDHTELQNIRRQNMERWQKHHGRHFEYDESGIDRRSNLSLQEFWDVYDGKWPVLLTDVVPSWPASNWTSEHLNHTYSKDRVTMMAVDGDLSKAVSLAVPVHRFYSNVAKVGPKTWTYVTDELFIPTRPQLKNDINETEYLEENFFKLLQEDVQPWDAMLLWGTKYSRSYLHIDPYNWTGTNAVLKGRKRWKLYPPGQDDYLYVKPNRKSGFPLDCFKYNSPVDAFDPDLEKYPLFKKAKSILFEQLPGELLIIPTGWFHQAYNGAETLAISGQMMNRNNYRVVLEEIIKAGNVDREFLPQDIDQMAPSQQVQTLASKLSPSILKKGRVVTEDVLKQINTRPKHPNEYVQA